MLATLLPATIQPQLHGQTGMPAEALEQIIEAKREHREPPALPEPEAEGEPGQIVDLMAALTQSVQKARADRGEDADVHDMPQKKTAKKQPAKKTATKKTPGRKPCKSDARIHGHASLPYSDWRRASCRAGGEGSRPGRTVPPAS